MIEEFGPKLMYIKGENNIVADALSRMAMTETDFLPEAFAADEHDFPEAYPLSFREIAFEQSKDKKVQELLEKQPDKYKKIEFKHSDDTYELVTRDGKIYLSKKLQKKATEWYHIYLCHQGETHTELTMAQHYCWVGMRNTVVKTCKACVLVGVATQRTL
jgi:Integrase zinc binding domain